MEGVKWYAAGGGIVGMGPYSTQRKAWESLTLTEDIQRREGTPYPKDARVWPEWDENKKAGL